ncbi:histidine phosphatase family protein [Methylopila henanensis]|uniref:Histidine phosphatase family protein n=1 Tax=Methylopila henanensis TaxID=873516 RepID=A0ABW4K6V4_9HYPH
MTHRLEMICAMRSRRPVFPGGAEPDDAGDGARRNLPASTLSGDRFWCGPEPMTRRTAAGLGLDVEVRSELAEIDFGSWRGRTLEDVSRSDPEGFRSWVAEPSEAPHGGESIEALLARVGGWLSSCAALTGRTVAVAPAMVVKACMLHVIAAPATSYARIDLEPLSMVVFVSDGDRWNLRAIGDRR